MSGQAEVQAALDELRDDYASEPIYVVGDNSEYGIVLEFGRGPIVAPEGSAIPIETEDGTIFRKRVSGHPPYPWFRPAIRELKANPERFIVKNSNLNGLNDINSTKELVEATAFALESQMKKNVTAQGSVDRSPGTKPDHPKVQSGNLRASISAVRIQ